MPESQNDGTLAGHSEGTLNLQPKIIVAPPAVMDKAAGAFLDGMRDGEPPQSDMDRTCAQDQDHPLGDEPPPHGDADAPPEATHGWTRGGKKRRGSRRAPPGDRPTIQIGTDQPRVIAEALEAFGGAKYPDIFQRNAELVRVIKAEAKVYAHDTKELRLPAGQPLVRPMNLAVLGVKVAGCADWRKYDGRAKKTVAAHPTQWVIQALAGWGEYPGIPPLRGIASYPMIRPDGSVSCEPGYDAGTGYYLASLPEGLDPLETVTREQAQAAAGRLLELVTDFPFEGNVDRAAWLAYLLTPLARAVIDGPTPAFLIGANVRGTGKTLLADVPGYILTGKTLPAQSYPGTDVELEKILVSVARYGLPVVCFDNVTSDFGGAVIDKWITSTSPTGRILGASEVVQFDWTTIIVATSNNARVLGDTDRRLIYVTMETEYERPETRSGFAIPDLPSHIREHRAELLRDALTILQGHYQAGLPEQGGRPKGTFESWAHRVRDALLWVGLHDCERAADDDARPVDSDTQILGGLLAGILEAFGDAEHTAGEIIDEVFDRKALDGPPPKALREALSSIATRGDRPSPSDLGKWIGRRKNRWLGDLCLQGSRDKHTKTTYWRVVRRNNVVPIRQEEASHAEGALHDA